MTDLILAATQGDLTQTQALLAQGININTQTTEGTTALIAAIEAGHFDLAQHFIDQGADVNLSDRDGWTALMAAAAQGDLALVQSLLSHGAEVNAQTTFGLNGLNECCCEGADRSGANFVSSRSRSQRKRSEQLDCIYLGSRGAANRGHEPAEASEANLA